MIGFSVVPQDPDADELLGALFAEGGAEGMTLRSVSLVMQPRQASSFVEGADILGLDAGVVLTIGDGTPPGENTSDRFEMAYGDLVVCSSPGRAAPCSEAVRGRGPGRCRAATARPNDVTALGYPNSSLPVHKGTHRG